MATTDPEKRSQPTMATDAAYGSASVASGRRRLRNISEVRHWSPRLQTGRPGKPAGLTIRARHLIDSIRAQYTGTPLMPPPEYAPTMTLASG